MATKKAKAYDINYFIFYWIVLFHQMSSLSIYGKGKKVLVEILHHVKIKYFISTDNY
jgi:hypothetical protein